MLVKVAPGEILTAYQLDLSEHTSVVLESKYDDFDQIIHFKMTSANTGRFDKTLLHWIIVFTMRGAVQSVLRPKFMEIL